MKIGVMRGRLREFDLAQVLQVVGLGRQYTGVEVSNDITVIGTIFVKSGKIVRVEATDAFGRDAFFKLFGETDGQFFVYRTDTPDALPEPLGAVDGLLMEAMNRKASEPESGPRAALAPQFTEGELPTHTGLAPPATGSAPYPEPSQGGEFPPAPIDVSTPAPTAVAPAPAPAPEPPKRRTQPPPKPTAAVAAEPAAPVPMTPMPAAVTNRSAPPPRRSSTPPPQDLEPVRREKAGLSGRILAVASPKGGCGKTTIALNLALSLARQGRSTILVDADINGDVLSAINARQRAEIGAFDVVLGVAASEEALLDTVLPNFKILPAVGGNLPRADLLSADHSTNWRRLLFELARRADVVIVDTPAGMFGVTHQVLSAATHVVGVLQAEVVANRSFPRFNEAIRALPDELRPEVLGIVVNMLQTKHSASLSVFQSACSDMPGDWLFDTSIPRHRAFLDSTQAGLPLRHLDDQSPPAVAWLFDNLAAEVAERLRLGTVEKKPMQLLL